MPFNGDVHSLPAGSIAANGTVIQDTVHNTPIVDISSSLSLLASRISGKQATNSTLAALATATPIADGLVYFTGSNNATTSPISVAGRALLDDATADAQLTTLGGGSAGTTVFKANSRAALMTALGLSTTVSTFADLATLTAADVAVGGYVETQDGKKYRREADNFVDADSNHFQQPSALKLTIVGEAFDRSYLMDLGFESGNASGAATRNAARMTRALTKAQGRTMDIARGVYPIEPVLLNQGITEIEGAGVGDGGGVGTVLLFEGDTTDYLFDQASSPFAEMSKFSNFAIYTREVVQGAFRLAASKQFLERVQVQTFPSGIYAGGEFTRSMVETAAGANRNQQNYNYLDLRSGKPSPGNYCGLLLSRGANIRVLGGHFSGQNYPIIVGDDGGNINTSVVIKDALIEIFGSYSGPEAAAIWSKRFSRLDISGCRIQIGNQAVDASQFIFKFGGPADTGPIYQRGFSAYDNSLTGHGATLRLAEWDGSGSAEQWLRYVFTDNTFEGCTNVAFSLVNGAAPIIIDGGNDIRPNVPSGLFNQNWVDGDTTPFVGQGQQHIVSNTSPTVITKFDGIPSELPYQFDVRATNANTTFDFSANANMVGNGGVDLVTVAGKVYRFVKYADASPFYLM
jgi:hypothetical protein